MPKGYIVLDCHTRQIFVSRYVLFHEHVFPFANTSYICSNKSLSHIAIINTIDFNFLYPHDCEYTIHITVPNYFTSVLDNNVQHATLVSPFSSVI